VKNENTDTVDSKGYPEEGKTAKFRPGNSS